jgi:hypothetical protein
VEPVTAPGRGGKAAKHLAFQSMSMTPARSLSSPASAHSSSGVATRSVDASTVPISTSSMRRSRAQLPRQRRRGDVGHGTGEQHDETLQHHHHVAAEARHLESHLGAALVQRAEEQAGQHDAQRMVAPISATAMPVKPAPLTNSSSSLCCTPAISFMPTSPARAAAMAIASSTWRFGSMPA